MSKCANGANTNLSGRHAIPLWRGSQGRMRWQGEDSVINKSFTSPFHSPSSGGYWMPINSTKRIHFPAGARLSCVLIKLVSRKLGTRAAAALGCPSQWKTALGKINLAGGGIFRQFVICNRLRFLAGYTPEERAELSYTTQVLLS